MLLCTFRGLNQEGIPIGAPPEQWENYASAIDLKANTFKCFNSNIIIDLSKLNDNYPDCPDGSDEPGTSFSPFKFYNFLS